MHLRSYIASLGDVLLSEAQLIIANRLEFCLFCMQVYNEICWLPLEAVLLRPCIALISIHVLAETEQCDVDFTVLRIILNNLL